MRSDSVVFVKPNFTWPRFRPGVVTSPQFLSALLPILKERANRVLLGESDLPIFNTSRAFKELGIERICKSAGVETVELSRIPSSRVEVSVGGKKIRLSLPTLLLNEMDVLVNVPVPKCHVITRMSGAMKNLYGLIPDPYRGNRHRHEINRAIVAVNKVVKSDLVVVDGLFSLDGRGPILGSPVRTNMIMAANNAPVADSLISRFFGMEPESIEHLRLAAREGLGPLDLAEVGLRGTLEPSIRLRPRKAPIDYLASLTFKSKIINKMIMDSPLSPLLYKVMTPFRSKQEVQRYEEDMGGLPRSQFRSD